MNSPVFQLHAPAFQASRLRLMAARLFGRRIVVDGADGRLVSYRYKGKLYVYSYTPPKGSAR